MKFVKEKVTEEAGLKNSSSRKEMRKAELDIENGLGNFGLSKHCLILSLGYVGPIFVLHLSYFE